MAYNFTPFKQKLTETEDWLKKEFGQIRTGRAAPALLDGILVESYGARVPINQIGSVNSEDPRTLRITLWDASQSKDVEKAITTANLGVSVSVDEKGVRIFFPELTSERRTLLIKVAKEKLESARVTLRMERDKISKDIDVKEKKDGMGEDEKFRLKDEMQKLIDLTNKKFDELYAKKEKEITS
jgi:ribosome recycling factor